MTGRSVWTQSVCGLVLVVGLAGVLQRAAAQERQLKKRVAVLNFEDRTDRRARWGGGETPGTGMADMLTTALVQSGRYTVLERAEIDRVLQEQDLGASGVVTPQSATAVGQMLGAEIVVFGSITEFGYRDRSTGGRTRRLGIGVESQSAVVAADVRMVNASTGEIVAADDVRESRSARGLRVNTRDLDFGTQSEFDESLVGKATRDAIERIVELLDEQAPGIPWEAKVVTTNGGSVFINAGAEAGVEVGDRFVVRRAGEKLVDPDTGLELGAVEQEVGVIEVVDNRMGDGKASRCSVVSGGAFRRGDLVRDQ